jgi:hypothetical protein
VHPHVRRWDRYISYVVQNGRKLSQFGENQNVRLKD